MQIITNCAANTYTVEVIILTGRKFKGEVHDFYKTSWFVEFEALSRMVKVRGSCDKPVKGYSRLKLTMGPALCT